MEKKQPTKKIFDLDAFIASRIDTASISCKSFIVTVFGDVISQHGGWIWLGSLIESLQPLGFSERLIRTSVFRLVQDDWLQVNKVGRKSYYAFTESANRHYTKAARRIYASRVHQRDTQWLIVLPTFVSEEKLPAFKRQLRWLGFSPLSSGAFAHPSIDQSSLEETLREQKLNDSVIVFSSQTIDDASNQVLKRLVSERWNLQDLHESYCDLTDCYSALKENLDVHSALSNRQSFLLRLLLIHEYRRVLLKDHELPENMLPQDWAGYPANQLVKNLYRQFEKGSCRYIVNYLANMDGELPPAIKAFNDRFNQ
ncbi:PaaX family transcriptional regulator [Aliikangiella coralliicola]|uniref:Phenylacetic acid degradation operon negative regulatory protein PaaX n=1 Tax=Aliikangiella coralliicola TaxID=2592383 RepID=A0A545TSR1_9GAMM|nr:PaaX family transcriptional regulator C-terminal domain-containing protein [Aliikangiella coralliicola]TQV80260.1 phenylacetic acid degradation operon negative regulatory protein PaaX [Aliikangiella coralliicola]